MLWTLGRVLSALNVALLSPISLLPILKGLYKNKFSVIPKNKSVQSFIKYFKSIILWIETQSWISLDYESCHIIFNLDIIAHPNPNNYSFGLNVIVDLRILLTTKPI